MMDYYVDCYGDRKNLGARAPAVRAFALTERTALVIYEALWATGEYDLIGLYDITGHRIHARARNGSMMVD
jgi:hypothetical protein